MSPLPLLPLLLVLPPHLILVVPLLVLLLPVPLVLVPALIYAIRSVLHLQLPLLVLKLRLDMQLQILIPELNLRDEERRGGQEDVLHTGAPVQVLTLVVAANVPLGKIGKLGRFIFV